MSKTADQQEVKKGKSLGELEAELSALRDTLRGTESVIHPRRVREHTATVMFLEEKPIVKFGSVKSGDSGNLEIEVELLDGEKAEKRTCDYLSLLNNAGGKSPRCVGKIKHQEFERRISHQGVLPVYIETSPADPVGVREREEVFVSRRVLLEEEKVKLEVTLEFLEGPWKGRELTVDSSCLNP